eukprot:90314_1
MATRIIKVSNAGFDDINGCYEEKKENFFEMIRGDNYRIYQIRIEDTTPFGMNVWTIKRIDGNNEICIYINTNDTIIKNDNNWKCIVGGKPYPLVEFISNSDDNQQKIMATKECNLTKRGKLKNCWRVGWKQSHWGVWAILNGHTLTVYRNEKELSNPSLSIHILQIVSVTTWDSDSKKFMINRTSGKDIYLETYSIKEKQEWMDALKLCMERMQIQVKMQCNTNIQTKTTYQANIAEFAQHMTHKQAQDLRVGDVIDHREENGIVRNAMVMDKYGSNVFLHYIGYLDDSNRWDICCSYDTELHRFASKDSISKRPAHRLKHLRYGDMLDVNCKSNGWKVAKIKRKESGQIEVSFYSKYSDNFWVHLDNSRECDALGVHTGNTIELRYNDFKSKLRQIPSKAHIFEDSIDYKHFLKLSNEYLLIVCGYIRHIQNNHSIIPYEIIVLIKNFTTANYFDLSKHAIFKCNVLFIENPIANNFKLDNGKYRDKETLIITKQNIDYNDFIELIYNRFGFQKYPYLQLNYYSSNNISNFDVKQFKYDTNVKAFDKYKNSIAIYFSPKLNEFDIIHSIYFAGEGMGKRGPFPLIYAGTESVIRSNKEVIIKKMLLFLGLDLNYSVFFKLNSINENHNGSMESKRIHLQIQSISHMRNCRH